MDITREDLQKALDDVRRLTEEKEAWVEKMAEVDDMAAQLKETQIELSKLKERKAEAKRMRDILRDEGYGEYNDTNGFIAGLEGMTEEEKALTAEFFFKAATIEDPRDFNAWRRNEFATKATTLGETTAAQGGYLVPEQVYNSIIGTLINQAIFMRDATRKEMTSKTAKEAAWATGWTVHFAAEHASITAGEPTWGLAKWTANKLAAYGKVSSELLEDANVNVIDELIMKMVDDMGVKIDSVGFGVTALSGYTGILPSANNQVTINTVTLAGITYADLNNGVSKLGSARIQGAKFYMSPWAFGQVRALTDSDGRPLWGADITGSFGSILGYPVVLVDQMPGSSENTATADMLLFGNLSKWYWGDRKSFSFERARVLSTDQWEMLGRLRIGMLDLASDSGSEIASNFVKWTLTGT